LQHGINTLELLSETEEVFNFKKKSDSLCPTFFLKVSEGFLGYNHKL